MDAILDDVKGVLRRTMLSRARKALENGDAARAAQHYRSLVAVLRQEAADALDDAARQRKLEAAASFEAEAIALETGTRSAPPVKPATAVRGERTDEEWETAERPDITLDDIVGLEEAKDEVRRAVLNPLLHPDWAQRFRVVPGGGILLYGPPGTGKTMLARAIAGTLDVPLFVVKGSDLLSKWQGESEGNLARLFESARQHGKSIIFVDEFQWLASKQDGEEVSEAGRRLICQLLQELQGFERQHSGWVTFLAATNYPWQLDQAAIRLGRFQKHIHVPPPDEAARQMLFERALSHRPTADIDYPRLADLTKWYTAADIVAIADAAARAALDRSAARDREEPIAQELVEAEIQRTKPSASQDIIRKCEAWAQSHSQ